MDNLDKVRARQKSKSEKLARKDAHRGNRPSGTASREGVQRSGSSAPASDRTVRSTSAKGAASGGKKRRRRKSKYSWIFTTLKVLFLVFFAAAIGIGIWIFSMIDFTFGDDLSSMNLNISSKVYYTNAAGEAVQYAQFDAKENRVWVPINKMPSNLKNAFVAIEDQRFFTHSGVDIKRTTSATLNYILRGDSTYGGSTITQQLVKNITLDNERTKTRKIREMLRALVLETKLSKEQILEMYLNTIYLSQGANGVEAAANIYFSKNVSELTLAECACIAGITQYPSKYDPITQPEANKQKRELVLDKMLELEYISKAEYDEAMNEEIKINQGKAGTIKIQSYFLDHLFEEIQADLVEKGYTPEFAANMIYNGGLKIYSTIDPNIQQTMEDYFESDEKFPKVGGEIKPQAAMVISDPNTGEIKGIVGGRGAKDRNRGLNRATQSKRQPGSSIKPIAVYAPALDMGLITESTLVEDSPLKIGNWTPVNSNREFRDYVSVKSAIASSYNIPAVRVLEELTLNKSFDYMRGKLHMDSLTDTDSHNYSVALGGLSNGVTVMEMNTAYSALANGGEYIEPHLYTKVYDVEGKILLNNEISRERAFSKSTSYLMSEMLKTVVDWGTAGGSKIPGMDTCGKTGTSDNSKDKWFIGYTPYYCASVWFGYDEPRTVSASTSPAVKIWKDIMTEIHADLPEKHFTKPSSVEKLEVCRRTGCAPTEGCVVVTQYADTARAQKKCPGNHKYIGTKSYLPREEWAQDEKDTKEDTDAEENGDTEDAETTDPQQDSNTNTDEN